MRTEKKGQFVQRVRKISTERLFAKASRVDTAGRLPEGAACMSARQLRQALPQVRSIKIGSDTTKPKIIT
jgi:hypothetical protein